MVETVTPPILSANHYEFYSIVRVPMFENHPFGVHLPVY